MVKELLKFKKLEIPLSILSKGKDLLSIFTVPTEIQLRLRMVLEVEMLPYKKLIFLAPHGLISLDILLSIHLLKEEEISNSEEILVV